MWSLLFEHFDDELVTALWEAGTSGLVENASSLRAFFDDGIPPHKLAFLGGEFRKEKNEPNTPLEDWEPIPIGLSFVIVPSSFGKNKLGDRLAIPLQPGLAFGTGRHETTQLCLEALERVLQPADVVFDVGCGSGILSAAAALLGATRVIGCDIEQQAVDMTRRQQGVVAFLGSADAIETGSADLTIANLTAPILDRLAWDLRRVTKPGGRVLLSGFMRDAAPQNFVFEQERERDGWLCWLCRPDAIRAQEPPVEGLSHDPEWWLSS